MGNDIESLNSQPSGRNSICKDPTTVQENPTEAEQLYHYTVDAIQKWGNAFFLEHEFLHRLNLVAIENNLAKCEAKIHEDKRPSPENLDQLRQLLSRYTTAIRDYEYMRQMRLCNETERYKCLLMRDQYFPELAGLGGKHQISPHFREIRRESRTAALDPIRDFLRRRLPHFLSYSEAEKKRRRDEYIARKPPEGVSPLVDRIARFFVAFVSGAALVVPMVIMSFQPSQIKSVITVSVAVLLFSVSMSLVMRASNTETLVSTATYAAVLVVFVGASGSPPA